MEAKKFMLRRITPLLSVIALILGIVTVVKFVGYNKEKAKYQPQIEELTAHKEELENQIKDLEASKTEAQKRYDDITADYDDIRQDLGDLAIFISQEEISDKEYLEDRMVDLLDMRQNLTNNILNEIDTNLVTLCKKYSLGEYKAPDRAEMTRDKLKTAVKEVTEDIGVSGIGTVMSGAIDIAGASEHILDGLGDGVTRSAGEEVLGMLTDAAFDVLGISKITNIIGFASGATDVLKNLSKGSTNPVQAEAYNKAAYYLDTLDETLSSSSTDVTSLETAINSYYKVAGYLNALEAFDENLYTDIFGDIGKLYNNLGSIALVDQAIGVCALRMEEVD